MNEFRKNKKFSDEEKAEIISFAKEHGIYAVKARFNVWPETVRYWLKPSLSDVEKAKKSERYYERKQDVEFVNKNKAYRQQRRDEGISRKKWREWYDSLDSEQRLQLDERTKSHRLDNIEHYKERARERYFRDKENDKGKY
jgi:transposase-like protein